MCGRFFAVDRPLIELLCDSLGVSSDSFRYSEDIAPGSTISILCQVEDKRQLQDATWWLLLDPTTLKPNYKFASFNSRSDKLSQPKSLGFQPFRQSRCLILAEGFVEGLGDKKTYHQIRHMEQGRPKGIAFGGLYRTWIHPQNKEKHFSTSIITLPAHPKWQGIHQKASPLTLPVEDAAMIDLWLDPDFCEVDHFASLLSPRFRDQQELTPIDRPSKRNPVGLSFWLEPDEVPRKKDTQEPTAKRRES